MATAVVKTRLVRSAILLFAAFQALAQNPATTVAVDAGANRHAINPNIYGVAYGDQHDMTTLNAPLNRWGGDATSRYNWQIDAHSAGADWYFETYSDGSGTPAGSADAFVATTRANQTAEPLFTIPMIDYLANLGSNRSTLEGFSVRLYGAQQATDPYNSDAGNGVSQSTGKDITGNSATDTGVFNSTTIQQGWVQHFVSTFGAASTATGIKYYILDNEPSLWYSTHRDVHPSPSTYQEMYNKIVAYSNVIRTADPSAKIVGPEEWSWWAMYFSGFDQANGSSAANSDYNTHGKTYYYPWLLQQLYAYKQQHGTQLLDVLTVHCYNGAPSGTDDSASGQQYRNKETRILWDPNFQDPSWYGDIGINGRIINWIATLKSMVTQYYPGLEIGCTEYNWGDEPNLNGATTQADVLGIYGREGFDLATRWTVAKNTNVSPTVYYVTYLASQIYRNYDGSNSGFGETSVSASVANPDNLSAFASVRASDGALTVMVINKQTGSTPVTVSLANFSAGGPAQAWQINSTSQTSIARLSEVSITNGAIAATVPSQSITLFIVPAAVGSSRTFVSTTGSDSNTTAKCAAADNCRTLAAALSVTSPGGEIVIVDSGGYGPVTISQPVIITAIDTDASISVTTSGASALTINTTGNVTLDGLSLHGGAVGLDGILVQQVNFLRVYNALVENFTADGVHFAVGGNLAVYDSRFNDNGHDGILIQNASANAFVGASDFNHNLNGGVEVSLGKASVTDSSAQNNLNGFLASGGSLTLWNDRAMFNTTALASSSGGNLQFARCLIASNTTAYNIATGSMMAGTSPGSTLIAPGQATTGTLSAPIAVR